MAAEYQATDIDSEEPQRTVMIVDDHGFSRLVLARILEAAKYRVVAAESGEDALARIEQVQPDAFMLDVEMPGMSGIELCQRLREQPRFHMTPILMVTAHEDPSVFRRAFAVGCDDFVDKPLSPLVVAARLGGLIKRYDYFRELERVRTNLARYISPRLRQRIERSARNDELPPPEEREVCILFSDIRGFTSLSQKLPPGVLFSNISRHLGAQVDAVYRNRGYVDKFAGDGIMAVFDGESMTYDACRCALEIMRTAGANVCDLPMPLGIGIHQGVVVAGNIGSGEHLDYSVIGNTVNLAARLCGYAESQDIVVSDVVRASVADEPEFRFVEPRKARIRGLDHRIDIFRLESAER